MQEILKLPRHLKNRSLVLFEYFKVKNWSNKYHPEKIEKLTRVRGPIYVMSAAQGFKEPHTHYLLLMTINQNLQISQTHSMCQYKVDDK